MTKVVRHRSTTSQQNRGSTTRARLGRAAIRILWLAVAVPLLAASPSPTAAPGGDPRSSGQGPGLVGDPLVALLAVLAIGLGALILTLVYVRLTARPPH